MSTNEQQAVKEQYHGEAMRYMDNAKEYLLKAGKEDNYFRDAKYVSQTRIIRSFSTYCAILCGLFLFFAPQHIQAQNIDSLYAVFSASRSETRISAANEIVKYGYENQYLDSLFTLKTTDEQAFVNALVHDVTGNYYSYEKADYRQSIALFKQAIDSYETIGDANAVYLLNHSIGADYVRLGDYENAVAYMMKCYEWEKSTDDSKGLSSTLNDLGVVYSQWQKRDMAVRYFEEAIAVERPLNRPMFYANRLASLAKEYSFTDAEKALPLIKEALECDEKIEHQGQKEDRMAVHQLIMGDVYYELDSLKNAENCYQKALGTFEKSGRIFNAANALLSLGRLQVKAGQYTEAVSTLKRCVDIAQKNNLARLKFDAYLILSEAYSRLEPNSMSYFYHREYILIRDSIFRATTQRQINEFQVKYETAEKQLEIERQQAKAEQHRLRSIVSLSIAVLLTALAVVLLVNNRKIHRKNIAITRQILENTRISATVAATPDIKPKMPENQTFAKIESYLLTSREYLNEDIDRNILARQLTTNYGYVVDAIKECTGMSFNEYINSMRLAHACTLLSDAENDANIENIAFECGFKNRTSFYRCFTAKYDISPRDFRNLAKK